MPRAATDPKPVRICIAITAASHLWALYRGQFQYLQEQGFEITTVAAPGPEHERLRELGIRSVAIPMRKTPAPLHDLVSLCRLLGFFARHRFDLVTVSSPKAALLAGLASFLTRQNRTVFIVRGRAYENKQGIARRVYASIDKLICGLSDGVLSVSREIRDDFVAARLVSADKIALIASGSGNGVDLNRFARTPATEQASRTIRTDLGIPEHAPCLLFSGRIRRDKGVNELITAYLSLLEYAPELRLLLLGSVDSVDPLDEQTTTAIETHPGIHQIGWCDDVVPYYAAADLFVLPSYREGLPNVVLEASAMELPVVAFDVIGTRESVRHGETGLLCSVSDSEQLQAALQTLLADAAQRRKFGQQGRQFVAREFASERVWAWLVEYYRRTLAREN